MQNKNLKAVIMIAAGILGLCLYFAACGDKPVEPKPVKDYAVYFYDAIHNEETGISPIIPQLIRLIPFGCPMKAPRSFRQTAGRCTSETK